MFRIGFGNDIHRLTAGRRLILGGVEIDSELGADGHSDADALTHAITDAIFGALALGDIGSHFPNSDERWRDAESFVFLRFAVSEAKSRGYSVVRQFVGHGTGRQMHEDPQVPNFGAAGSGKRLKQGLVIAVEPMVNAGAPDVEVLDDKWTAVTRDRSMSAHFEHTIAVTEEGPWVLTRPTSKPGIL